MIIIDVQQNSEAWMMARCGKITASEMDNLVSPEGKVRSGQGIETYLYNKVYERIAGYPEKSFSGGWADQGRLNETRAIPFYEFTTGEKVDRVGFITTDDGTCGASPDGIIGTNGGIEVKCPSGPVHIGYLLGNRVPKEYILQVQMSLWVTRRQWWVFMSYHAYLTPLVVKVLPDPVIQASITEALAAFLPRLDAAEGKVRAMMEHTQRGRASA